MAIYYPSSCDEVVPDHICDPCEGEEKGKIRSAGYIKNTFDFSDPSNPTEWQAGIESGDIIVIPAVIGSFDGGSEVEGSGYGDQSTKLTGYNFSANYKDPNYKQNATFYNSIKRSRLYKFFYRTGSQTHISDTTVSVVPKNPVTEDQNSDVTWDVTVKWAGADLPVPFDTPPGIFDQCFAVS